MRVPTAYPVIRSLIVLAMAGAAIVTPMASPGFDQVVFPGSTLTSPTGINPRGDIVGQYALVAARHGFLLDKTGTYTSIDFPGATATSAWGINAAGVIAGDYSMPGSGVRAFVMRDGQWTTFDCAGSLGAVHTFAAGVSASGEVVGEYKLPGVPLGSPGRAYLWDGTTCIDITPPAAGTGAAVAVVWTINDAGDTGGYYVRAGGAISGWVRDRHGEYVAIDYPGSAFTNLRGLSAAGDTVGLYRLAAAPAVNRGFFRSANDEWTPIDYPGALTTRALGINARGDIVGDYRGGDCPITACGWVLRR